MSEGSFVLFEGRLRYKQEIGKFNTAEHMESHGVSFHCANVKDSGLLITDSQGGYIPNSFKWGPYFNLEMKVLSSYVYVFPPQWKEVYFSLRNDCARHVAYTFNPRWGRAGRSL